MLKGLAIVILMTGCLLGASALPTRASSLGSALRRRDSSHRPARNPQLDDLALTSTVMDQSAEASSNVDDIVPHSRNRIDFGKYRYGYPDFYRYKSKKNYPLIVKDDLDVREELKDCGGGCDSAGLGIVTVGESRSYSVVSGPQMLPQEQPVTETEDLATGQDSTTTEWVVTQPLEITEESPTERVESIAGEIISVRVSSSIGKSGSQPEPAALQTENQPFATAVQRSHFSVEEAIHEPLSTSEKVRTDSFSSRKFEPNDLPLMTSTALPRLFSTATSSTMGRYPTPSNERSDRSLYLRNPSFSDSLMRSQGSTVRTEMDAQPSALSNNAQIVVLSENTSPPVNPLSSPVNYHTSLHSATSGSRVSFYREPPNFRRSQNASPSESVTTTVSSLAEQITQRLKHETRVETVSFHEEVVLPQKGKDVNKNENDTNLNDAQKSYQFTNVHDQSFHHVQVMHLNGKKDPNSYEQRKRYQQLEKSYGMPEQNYEVDEALSVRSNGRAHGVQSAPATRPDNNKFGYVVEGRDFKKYRVEERTADGFIVGEYGVVRHEDGSTRGVRYTADSTINPKVIYEALVKFLSL